jgi:hypothetical protein
LVIATGVKGVFLDWGKPSQRMIERMTPNEIGAMNFPAGSIGPKVQAARRFVGKTGKCAPIGSLADLEDNVAGTAGANVLPDLEDTEQRDSASPPAPSPPWGFHHDSGRGGEGEDTLGYGVSDAHTIPPDRTPLPLQNDLKRRGSQSQGEEQGWGLDPAGTRFVRGIALRPRRDQSEARDQA